VTRTEATKTLKRLREYRSRLMNDYCGKVEKFVAAGRPAHRALAIAKLVQKFTPRIRLANARIDQIESFFPRTS
jgi:hypothetical protein